MLRAIPSASEILSSNGKSKREVPLVKNEGKAAGIAGGKAEKYPHNSYRRMEPIRKIGDGRIACWLSVLGASAKNSRNL
ncbi:MAG: hypothetical protein PWQ39_1404 [Thermacetogenium sp.]|nr:hypothetical protein [Thermacetogenium sp.]